MSSCPPITQTLLDHLQRVFPDKLPDNPTSPDTLGVLIGQQKVIKHLQAQFKLQNKSGMPDVT